MDKSGRTIGDTMAGLAEDAVGHALADSGLVLDYSPASVEHVEAVLAKLYGAIPRSLFARIFRKQPSAAVFLAVCRMYGAYLGEVLRRVGGGEWVVDRDVSPGLEIVCLELGDARVWPVSKVQKRLVDGPEDNVWHYYQVVRQTWGSGQNK